MAVSSASSFLQCSLGTSAQVQALLEKGDVKQVHYGFSFRSLARPAAARVLFKEKSGTIFTLGRSRMWPSYVKASHAALAVAPESIASESDSQGQLEKENQNSTIFPDGFESLIMEVCDETDVAELKLKVGNFELHMRRNMEKAKVPSSFASPLTPPPVPSKPMVDSVSTDSPPAPSSPVPKPSSPNGSTNLFTSKLSLSKTSKFGLLEAAGDEGLRFVTSPKVGFFRKCRVVKGKRGQPLCEEGQSIKEGQVVCYLDQLGTQQPVTSEVSGEIVKILWDDGEPVGYGDPLIAVLPSFHGIK
eukprot:Gb_17356 [translate_table: standard]